MPEELLDIRDVLNRRNDLSTFVVHLSRDGEQAADANLRAIIAEGVLRASKSFGWAASQDDESDQARQSQRCVCFSETPLEHIYSMVANILGRSVRLQPYGLAFTKIRARRRGVNPVWYVDMTPGRDWTIRNALNDLRDEAISVGFHSHPAARILPFIEPMGTWENSRREFWWEREWRHQGDMYFGLDQVALWLCPEHRIPEFETLIQAEFARRGLTGRPRCIDPRWGLEEIVAHLADQEETTPFGV
jgi:hypothetical protein